MFKKLQQWRDDLDHLKRLSRLRLELRELDTQIEREQRPELPEVLPDQKLWYRPDAKYWRLRVPGKPDAFMCLDREFDPTWHFVVYVHGLAFRRFWLATMDLRDPQACRLRGELTMDRKFQQAASGFAEGQKNPVPLAVVTPNFWGDRLVMGFRDGVTRSMWLLANGVPAFPVVCAGRDKALKFAELVGLTKPLTVDTLERI